MWLATVTGGLLGWYDGKGAAGGGTTIDGGLRSLVEFAGDASRRFDVPFRAWRVGLGERLRWDISVSVREACEGGIRAELFVGEGVRPDCLLTWPLAKDNPDVNITVNWWEKWILLAEISKSWIPSSWRGAWPLVVIRNSRTKDSRK